jgi:hypothetical protein
MQLSYVLATFPVILAKSMAVRINFLDSFILSLPSHASGELEMRGWGFKACFDGVSGSMNDIQISKKRSLHHCALRITLQLLNYPHPNPLPHAGEGIFIPDSSARRRESSGVKAERRAERRLPTQG